VVLLVKLATLHRALDGATPSFDPIPIKAMLGDVDTDGGRKCPLLLVIRENRVRVPDVGSIERAGHVPHT